MKRFLLGCILCGAALSGYAQEDSLRVQADTIPPQVLRDTVFHSPRKAAIYSAVLPGLGQAYNRKYWKMPLVYAAVGTSIYFIVDNTRNYRRFRNEYLFRINHSGQGSDQGLQNYSDSQLRTVIDQYQRWRDLSYVALALSYVLNIVDATVDGYLWRFDTGPDLSFRLRPTLVDVTRATPGLHIRIKF